MVAGFLATGFLTAVAGFLAGVVGFLVAAGFLAGAGFLRVVGLTPADLASLATLALRRLAEFFLSRPFLTALSYSDWTLLALFVVGFFLKSLRAVRIFFLI